MMAAILTFSEQQSANNPLTLAKTEDLSYRYCLGSRGHAALRLASGAEPSPHQSASVFATTHRSASLARKCPAAKITKND